MERAGRAFATQRACNDSMIKPKQETDHHRPFFSYGLGRCPATSRLPDLETLTDERNGTPSAGRRWHR